MANLARSIPPPLLFIRMLAWSVSLRLIQRRIAIRKLVRLAVPKGPGGGICVDDVLGSMRLLNHLRLWSQTRGCLIRALVCYRFLLLAGAEPTLYIGFNDSQGHAWVEISGQPVLESQADHIYQPTLVMAPGSQGFWVAD